MYTSYSSGLYIKYRPKTLRDLPTADKVNVVLLQLGSPKTLAYLTLGIFEEFLGDLELWISINGLEIDLESLVLPSAKAISGSLFADLEW